MNNEPVAWLMVNRDDGNKFIQMGKPTRDDKVGHEPYPLYSHPAKTLTDEEIDVVGDAVSNHIDTYAGRREFAKAILRKAQENG